MTQKWLRKALLPVAMPMLAACTAVGPDYRLPDHALVRAPESNMALAKPGYSMVSPAPVPDDWWRLYDDPKVDELVQRALVANTSLRVAAANLRRAVANYHEVESENLVQGGIAAKAERAQLAGESVLLTEKVPVFNLGDYGISASYLVDLFGKLARADEAALSNAESSQAALDAARVAVVAQTVRAYVEGCAAGQELQFAARQLILQRQVSALARRMVAAGKSQPSEASQAQSEAERLESALPVFKARKAAAAYRLSVMLGEPPGESSEARAECNVLPALSRPMPVGDGAALLRRRPDLRQAERDLASATARIGVATADLYPSVRIGASAGVTGLLSDLGTGPTVHWGFGPLLTWSFPSNGVRPRIHAMEANADATLARFDGAVLKALEETRTALNAYANELERNQSLRKAKVTAAAVASEHRQLYQGGRLPYLASLDADRTLNRTEQELAASDSQIALRQVTLFEALGGGWKNAPAPIERHTP